MSKNLKNLKNENLTPHSEQGVNPAANSAGLVAGGPLLPMGPLFKKINSDYIFKKKILDFLKKKKILEIIKYNKSTQKRMYININHYKTYSETKTPIELDIIPLMGEYGTFININEEDKKYFHIYFNDNKKKKLKILHYIKMIMFLKYR